MPCFDKSVSEQGFPNAMQNGSNCTRTVKVHLIWLGLAFMCTRDKFNLIHTFFSIILQPGGICKNILIVYGYRPAKCYVCYVSAPLRFISDGQILHVTARSLTDSSGFGSVGIHQLLYCEPISLISVYDPPHSWTILAFCTWTES